MTTLEFEFTEIGNEQEINWDIFSDWTRIVLKNGYKNRQHSVDIVLWAEQNCKDQYTYLGRVWIFKSEQDAVHFTLRWV